MAASSDGSVIFASHSDGLRFSTDAGLNWADIAAFSGKGVQSVALSSDGQKVVVCSEAMVFTSADQGTSWTERYIGANKVASSADGQTLMVGAGDSINYGSIHISFDAGVLWQAVNHARNWTSIACSADGKVFGATDYDGFPEIGTPVTKGQNEVIVDAGRCGVSPLGG